MRSEPQGEARQASTVSGFQYEDCTSQLIAKGYGRETVEAVLSSMDDIDFTRLCSDFIRKKYDPFPTERKERDKAFATLMRRGYPSSTLREALTLIKNETDT